MVFGWNCETFATYCKTGINATSQYADLVLTWIKTFINPIHDTVARMIQERYRSVFAGECDGGGDGGVSDRLNGGSSGSAGTESPFLTVIIGYLCPHAMFLS